MTEVCKSPYRGTADGRKRERGKCHRKGEGCHSEGFVKPLKVSLVFLGAILVKSTLKW